MNSVRIGWKSQAEWSGCLTVTAVRKWFCLLVVNSVLVCMEFYYRLWRIWLGERVVWNWLFCYRLFHSASSLLRIDNNCFFLLCKCSGLLWIETKGIDHGKLQYAGLVMKKVMKMEATRLHFKHDKATQKAMMRINICTFKCISHFCSIFLDIVNGVGYL